MPPNDSPAQPDPHRPDRGRGLRGVPGGYDLDGPPIHVAPITGESAVSWLRRAAVRYQISPRNVLRAGGARRQVASTAAATRRVLAPWNSHTTRLGLTEQERASLRAPTPLGAALTAHARLYQRTQAWREAWTQTPTSRYCPACLADPEPWWPKDWSNPLQPTCLRHGVLLLSACPACQALPHQSPTWLGEPLQLRACTARTDRPHSSRRQVRPWCGHDLRTAPTQEAEPEQLRAARLLLDLATGPGGHVIEMCGISVTTRIAFDALIELAAVALHRRGSHVQEPPEDVATALADTLDVLEATCPQRAGEHLQRLLRPSSRQAPITHTPATAQAPKNPLLGALQLGHHAGAMTAASQLTFRTGARHGQYPTPVGASRAVHRHLLLPEHHPDLPRPSTAWIPQVIWPGTLPGADDQDPACRAELSLLLARLGSTRPWAALVIELGLPRQFHHTLIARTRTRRANGTWPHLLARLDEVLEQLRAKPPWVNYRHRRILADDLPLLAQALTLAHTRQEPPGVPVQRRFWELFTEGDALYAPGPLTIDPDGHERWSQQRGALDAEHNGCFEAAFQILDRSSPLRLGRPLTWRPP